MSLSPASAIPTELIKHILELWVERAPEFSPRYSYVHIRRAALISRAWSGAASEVLWRRISLETVKQANDFMADPGLGKYITEEVSIQVLAKGFTLPAMLEKLKGVKELVVGEDGIAATLDFLRLPSLSALASLKIGCSVVGASAVPTSPVSPSFRLQHLTLCGKLTSQRTAIPLLLATSPTLISLDLSNLDGELRPNIPDISFPNLVTIKLCKFSRRFVYEVVIPHSPKLQHLYAMDRYFDLETLFKSPKLELPVGLRSLEFSNIDLEWCWPPVDDKHVDRNQMRNAEVLEEAFRECEALKKLEVFCVGWPTDFLDSFEKGRELLETMKRMGVRLEGLNFDRETMGVRLSEA
ncbi:hypothetical protein P7C70_g3992, partial [Phenoliferia sp. Uapishka_3]